MKRYASLLLMLTLISLLAAGAIPNIKESKAIIPGINIIVSPITQTADNTLNQFAYYSVLVQSVSGFAGPVNLNITSTAIPGLSISFPGGSDVDVPANGQAFTYLLATVGAGLPVGNYTIEVTGFPVDTTYPPAKGTTVLHAIQYVAGTRDFRLSSTPGTIVDVVPGGSGALQVNVQSFTTDPTVYCVSLLLAPSIPGLVSASFSPATVCLSGYATNTSILVLTTTTLTPAGNYSLVITGSTIDGLIHSWAITLRVNGFVVTPTPSSKSVILGKCTNYQIGVMSVGTFSSTVTLSLQGLPAGMTANINPPAVLPAPMGTASAIATICTNSSLAQGTYILTLRGTSGTLKSEHMLSVSVGNFNVSATPSSKTIEQNSTGTFTVTGISSDDYSADMTLTVTGLPTGVTGTFSQPSVKIPPASSNSTNLNLAVSPTAPIGTFTINITGTSGTQSHMTQVTLMIVAATDFSLTLNPSSATVRNGSSTTFNINVNSLNAFNSPVALAVSVPPASGLTGSINPTTVTPPSDGIGTATLTITTAPTAPQGSGTITVTGTTATKTRSRSVTLTVSPTAGRPCIIATATYGSEVAPEVYFLRLFRDRSIQTTFAGNQFMNVFNAWYYSFSPSVAEQVKSNLVLRNISKAVIYPLIGTLYLAQWSYSALSFAPELAVVVAGLVASSLIGIVYFAPITLLAIELAKRRRLTIHMSGKPLAVAWLSSAALILAAEVSSISPLMMVGTAAFVLATITSAVKVTVTQTQRILH
jgi:hypothetical protein